jgi:hypothetical protein
MQDDAPRTSLTRRAGAVAIVALAAYLLLKVVLHVIVGVVSSVLWAVVAIAAVVALVWASRQF